MKWIVLGLGFILMSCETNWGKYGGYYIEYESAMDYYLAFGKGEVIHPNDSKNEQLRKGTFIKYVRANGKIDSVLAGKEHIVIEPYVHDDNISYDSTYILIKQKPLQDICECNGPCLLERYGNHSKLPTYQMCRDALEKSNSFKYWIVNKSKDIVYGPMTINQYDKKRFELDIPKDLNLH